MIDRINCDGIERFIRLNHIQAREDPYVLRLVKQAFLNENRAQVENGRMRICILTDNSGVDMGYALLNRVGKGLFAEEIFIIKAYRSLENCIELLDHIRKMHKAEGSESTRFIGLLNQDSFTDALKKTGFILEKEHIQMELAVDSGDGLQEAAGIVMKSFIPTETYLDIYNYMQECLAGSINNYTPEEVKERIEDEKGFVHQLYMGEEPVGFCISFINEQRNKQEHRKVFYIEQIAIHGKYRSKGYGFRSMRALIELAKRKGCGVVRLHVYRSNVIAYKLYNNLGFEDIKCIGHWVYYG